MDVLQSRMKGHSFARIALIDSTAQIIPKPRAVRAHFYEAIFILTARLEGRVDRKSRIDTVQNV